MPALTALIGALLTANGLVAYFASDSDSATALIPSVIGVILLLAAVIARNDKARPHAMHAALLVAVIGILGSFMPIFTSDSTIAIVSSVVMLVLLVVLIVFGVRSFIAARQARQAS